MGVVNTKINAIQNNALSQFDNIKFMGFGSNAQAFSGNDTNLITPILRKALDEDILKKSDSYEFTGVLGLTEANGETIREVGLFDMSSGGVMDLREVLPSEISKTNSVELSVGIKLTIEVMNDE